MNFTTSEHLSADHTQWINGLDFYNDEFDILEKRLTEVSNKNTSFEARQGIEHFQNQFMIQRKNISDLKHEINNHVKEFGHEIQVKNSTKENSLLMKHSIVQEKYESFEKLIKTLRHEFNEFLSKWM